MKKTTAATAESIELLSGTQLSGTQDVQCTLGYIDLVLIHSPQSNRDLRLDT